ncbi:MAG: hypothetical protein J6C82_03600 [Clostridia bacterium]|nr:hypothetical protein [Clostridia bacterium]
MTADLFFYIDAYGGNAKIPAAEFPLWERRAEAELLHITGGKTLDDERVKLCVCEMAELLYEEGQRTGISSENNDGYSVSYEKGDIKSKLYQIAQVQLFGTDLLYRGVGCDK